MAQVVLKKVKRLANSGNIPEGAAKKNFIKFANKAMEIGRQSGRGLRTIGKFAIIPRSNYYWSRHSY